MEGKKLNFNQPFLSVRRNPPTVTKTNNNSHSVIPQLPPHRSELKSGPVRNPGAVPFLWEQTPGQPKQETEPKHRSTERPPIAPKLPPGRNPNPNQHGCNNSVSPTTNDNNRQVVIVETSHVENLEREEENESCTDSDDSDGAYVDALDTLSRTESFFLNCSMSGLSGLDDLDIKPSERFSTDPKAREFMMDRFLPAAKAMTSETPQYATKTQNAASQEQQQQQLKKIVNQYKPSLRYGPSFAKRYSHYNGSEEEEEEEEEVSDDDYDQHANSLGVCGLIPRFCLKGSFGVLNHVPAISVRTRVPLSSCNKLQPRSSSSAGYYRETEIKSRSNRTEIKSIDKIREAALSEDKTKLRDDSGQLETFISEEKTQAGIEGFGFHGKCGVTTFEELLADQDSPNESNSGCPVIEKTLYVNTIQSVESPNLTTFSLSKQDSEDVPRSRKQDHEIVTKRTDQMDAIDSSLEDFKNKLNPLDVQEKFGDIKILSSTDKTTECRVFSSTIAKKIQLVTEKEAITVENSYRNYSQLPIPPPLPKSPSDSWLWRTLPSMSAQKSSLSLYINAATKPQNEVSEDRTATNMKWETIVKTTKMPRHDSRYSRESLTAIPET